MRAWVRNRPVRMFSVITEAVDFSSSTSRPLASEAATWTPRSAPRSWPGTVQDRSRVPDPLHSKTRERAVSPCGFVYVPAYTRPFGCLNT